jgi:spore coat protein U-like protein
MKTTLSALALAILASGPAVMSVAAATASASIGVSATVQASCLASTSGTVFRTDSAPSNAASAVSITCSNSVPYTVTLSATAAPGATVARRQMTISDFSLLGHALISNILGTANRGQAVSAGTVGELGSCSNSLLAIRHQLPAAQYATPSAYSDAMIVVVTY